jgi:hypothetical protein
MRRHQTGRHRAFRAAILALTAFLALTAPALPAPRAIPERAIPEQCGRELDGPPAVYLGGWIPAALDDPRLPRERDPLGEFDRLANKRVSVLSRWVHWGLDHNDRVDVKWLRRVAQAGALPMITWVPWDPTIPKPEFQRGFMLRDVAEGVHDWYIADIASEVADWDGPLFIRFAQEMNGTWYPWGKHQNSPDEFVAAWHRIHRIFSENGAGHATWVWNPNEKNHPESLGLWYPGDDVVDWVAVDGYNWDAPQYWRDRSGNTWRLLDQVFRPSFDDMATFVPADKPRMIAETATNERADDPGMKAAWICDAFRRALPEALPEVRAVLWFNEPTNEGGWVVPWPIDSSDESREAFAAAVSPDYYVGDLGRRVGQLGQEKIPEPASLLER